MPPSSWLKDLAYLDSGVQCVYVAELDGLQTKDKYTFFAREMAAFLLITSV
jgi:hypothetical protein